jgi:hypothetical protein
MPQETTMKSTTILALAKAAHWIDANPEAWESGRASLESLLIDRELTLWGLRDVAAALGLPDADALSHWGHGTASEASRQLWAIVAETEPEDDGISDRFRLPPLDPRDEYRHPEDFSLPEWAEGV